MDRADRRRVPGRSARRRRHDGLRRRRRRRGGRSVLATPAAGGGEPAEAGSGRRSGSEGARGGLGSRSGGTRNAEAQKITEAEEAKRAHRRQGPDSRSASRYGRAGDVRLRRAKHGRAQSRKPRPRKRDVDLLASERSGFPKRTGRSPAALPTLHPSGAAAATVAEARCPRERPGEPRKERTPRAKGQKSEKKQE